MEKSISFDTGLPTPPPKFAFLFLIDICRDFFYADGNLPVHAYGMHIIGTLLFKWCRREVQRVSLSVRQLRFKKKKK